MLLNIFHSWSLGQIIRESKEEWINYINSFAIFASRFPSNSFIDEALISGYSNFSNKKLKNLAKLSLIF